MKMTSITQNSGNGDINAEKVFDVEQQRQDALVVGLPKSLGAGVSPISFHNNTTPLILFLSPPWLLEHSAQPSQHYP
jgi:hypothetical protein